MDVDEVDVDPASIEHPKRTKEPAKQAKNEDSPVLKKTYTGAEGSEDNARTFLTLYVKIVNAEDKHEVSNQETMEEHEAQRQVNDEVRDQLPKNNENYALKENRAGAKNL
uniref:Uncharacterized protein n=1 Tax=Rhizophagus irregularis (strain DAOM 181602 / DAOM 197198 / MUCL 43194) TaxID=747089 RepID=U9T413_RHIID